MTLEIFREYKGKTAICGRREFTTCHQKPSQHDSGIVSLRFALWKFDAAWVELLLLFLAPIISLIFIIHHQRVAMSRINILNWISRIALANFQLRDFIIRRWAGRFSDNLSGASAWIFYRSEEKFELDVVTDFGSGIVCSSNFTKSWQSLLSVVVDEKFTN